MLHIASNLCDVKSFCPLLIVKSSSFHFNVWSHSWCWKAVGAQMFFRWNRMRMVQTLRLCKKVGWVLRVQISGGRLYFQTFWAYVSSFQLMIQKNWWSIALTNAVFLSQTSFIVFYYFFELVNVKWVCSLKSLTWSLKMKLHAKAAFSSNKYSFGVLRAIQKGVFL